MVHYGSIIFSARAFDRAYLSNNFTPCLRDLTKASTWHMLTVRVAALHSVACTIIHLLGIPSQLALQEDTCHKYSSATELEEDGNNQCQRSSSNGNTCCNIDLLRVFRYDAISPLNNNDNSTATTTTMGSSPHSDWGTITVIYHMILQFVLIKIPKQ